MVGKDRSHIRGYLQGRYGFTSRPAYGGFQVDPMLMVVNELPVIDRPIGGGIDMGGNTLNPAAVFGQRHPAGTG